MEKSERCHTENHDVPLPEPEHITTQRQTLPDAFAAGKLVRPERFELPTYSSGGCRSIQLSYGRAADSSSVHCSRDRLNEGRVRTGASPVQAERSSAAAGRNND